MSTSSPQRREAPWAASERQTSPERQTSYEKPKTDELPVPDGRQTLDELQPLEEGPATDGPRPSDERPGAASSALTAVLTGVLVGAVATAMHGGIWYLDGWWLPWGLVFSGALLLCAGLWCGTSTRRVWAAAVPGLITYLIAWATAYLRQGSALVVTQWSAPIGVVGIAWFVVVFVVVMASVIVTGRWLARRCTR